MTTNDEADSGGDWIDRAVDDFLDARPDCDDEAIERWIDSFDVAGRDKTALRVKIGLRREFRHIPLPDATPTQIRKYRIERTIGSGAMGVVYEVLSPDGHRSALKLRKVGPLVDSDSRRRFDREIRVGTTLDHPNICPILDVGRHGESEFFVMPLFEGKTLRELIDEQSIVDTESRCVELTSDVDERRGRSENDRIRTVLRFFATAARALHSAHMQNVVHRDLKPSNLFVLARDASPIVLDFGLARDFSTDGSRLTLSDMAVGTPAYMAPEQFDRNRSRDVNAKTDICALGYCLFESLTLRRALAPASHLPAMRDIVEAGLRERPSKSNSRLHTDIDVVVDTCCRVNPRRRYATANQLADDLDALADGRRPRARSTPIVIRVKESVSRHRLPWIAGVLLSFIVFLAVHVIVTSDERRLGRELSALEDRERRLQSALVLESAGQSSASDEIHDRLLSDHPSNARLHFSAILAALRGRSLERAERLLEVARTLPDTESATRLVNDEIARRRSGSPFPESVVTDAFDHTTSQLDRIVAAEVMAMNLEFRTRETGEAAIRALESAYLGEERPSATIAFRLATVAYAVNSREAAKRWSKTIDAQWRSLAAGRYFSGMAHLVNDPSTALQRFEECGADGYFEPHALAGALEACRLLKDWEHGREILKKIDALRSPPIAVVDRKISFLRSVGDSTAADESFRRLAEGPDVPPEVLWHRAKDLGEMKRFDELIPILEEILRKVPHAVQVSVALSAAYGAMKSHAKIRDLLEPIVHIDPNNDVAWSNLAQALQSTGEPGKAALAYERVTKLRPDDASAWWKLGNLEAQAGRHDRAYDCYRRAVLIEPDNADYASNLAANLTAMGRSQAAEAFSWLVIIDAPGHQAAFKRLRATFTKLAEPERSRKLTELYRAARSGHAADVRFWRDYREHLRKCAASASDSVEDELELVESTIRALEKTTSDPSKK